MAAVDVVVSNLVTLWRIPAVRRNFPRMFLVISVVGSILKELQFVPQTYFSSRRNFLNVYFVKVSWGWTLLLLTPFVLLSNTAFSRNAVFLGKRLLSVAVATAVWYACTTTFFYIEGVTGSCFQTDSMDVKTDRFASIAECKHAGFYWHGFDISGHSFILTYSALLIMEETASMASLKTASMSALPRVVLNLLYVALNLIVILWVWMFICTSVYFHDVSHKVVGTAAGLGAWYLTYRLWYLKPLSPGLPPQHQLREQKQLRLRSSIDPLHSQ
ncbi:acyl-coenzyme A diphosphatase FITM2 [Hippocampus comes]|nr:PREDICTED: fat storage-inducing transmembrane protein 2 [Hippocampus comes]